MSYAPQSSPGLLRLPACALVASLVFAAPAAAQEETALVQSADLYRDPDGVPLVSLPAGTSVETGRSRGAWHEAVVEGWIFTGSTERTRRDGFDLVVTPDDGENLRLRPNGPVVGRVREGTLLKRLGTRGNWTRVRRAGWLPRAAVVPSTQRRGRGQSSGPPRSAGSTQPSSSSGQQPAPQQPASQQPVSQQPASQQPPSQQPAAPRPGGKTTGTGKGRAAAAPPAAPAETAAGGEPIQTARQTTLAAAAEGGTLGVLQGGAPARLMARAGDQVKVQVEGWIPADAVAPSENGVMVGVTAEEVRADPDRYVGQILEWRLQLIAVREADELRPEMPPGQPYLLTRGPLPEPGFVYVTIPPERLPDFRALPALQELILRVTVRAARTKFLPTPVVELASVVAGLDGK
ncbi:MAG: hypothetical protein ACTHM9_16750 [Gemmatimonadales bacterium]